MGLVIGALYALYLLGAILALTLAPREWKGTVYACWGIVVGLGLGFPFAIPIFGPDADYIASLFVTGVGGYYIALPLFALVGAFGLLAGWFYPWD